MNTVKIFSVIFSEKNRAFLHDKLLIGTIFAEREREREREREITTGTLTCIALFCAHTPSFFRIHFTAAMFLIIVAVFCLRSTILLGLKNPAGFLWRAVLTKTYHVLKTWQVWRAVLTKTYHVLKTWQVWRAVLTKTCYVLTTWQVIPIKNHYINLYNNKLIFYYSKNLYL